ncbi:V-type ATPase 116kDa subunit family protein [Pseudothermotoga sp.]|uniref:V-type ATP synthase subunit I n=1 Tax=Pseudothermotoga sp. TaxID=2033661 RepID=UPI0031F66795
MAVLKVERFWLVVPREEESKLLEIFKLFPRIHWERTSYVETQPSKYTSKLNKIEETFKITMELFPSKRGLLESFFSGREEIDQQHLHNLLSEMSWKKLYHIAKWSERSLENLKRRKETIEQIKSEVKFWSELNSSFNFPRQFERYQFYSGTLTRKNFDLFLEQAKEFLEDGWVWSNQSKKDVKCIIVVRKENADKIEKMLQKYEFNHRRIPYLKSTPSESLKRLEKALQNIEKMKEKVLKKASIIREKIKNLQAWYDYFLMKSLEEKTVEFQHRTNYFVAYTGWIPTIDKQEFVGLLENKLSQFGFESRDPLPDEDPPVILHNPRFLRPFEFLTKLYGMPKYGGIDPTPYVAPFYLIFFGICLGDVGYGLTQFFLVSWIRKKFKPEGGARELLDLLRILSFPSILVGLLTWSFFGSQPFLGPDGKFLGIFPVVNPTAELMKALAIALFIGVFSQMYALVLRFISGLKTGDYKAAVYDGLLWLLFLTSMLIYFGLQLLTGKAHRVFLYMLFVSGIGLILTQGRDKKNFFSRIVVGIISLYGIVGAYGISSFVGDVLSYSRLFALNLVGSVFGSVITQLAQMVKGLPVLGWVMFALIWIGGQLLNYVLSALSAFVHSTRLQFLEMFGKFYSAGGRRFTQYSFEGKYFKVRR